MNEAFINLLQCPKTGQGLRLDISGKLLTEDGRFEYPILDGIPQLLVEDAIVRVKD